MNYLYDPNAGRYRGNDPEAARAFRELQRVVQQLRGDPMYKITSLLAQVGSYQAVAVWGKPTADGIAAHPPHWGMQTDGTNAAKLLINTLESPTNAAHAIPLGAVIEGSRRLHYNGQDCIWISQHPSAFSGSNGVYIDPGPDGGGVGGGGGGGGDGGGGGGGGDGPGGGGGGGGPGGGGDDGSCPLIKTVTIAGTGNPNYDTTWSCVWTGSDWTSAPGGGGLVVHVQLGTSALYGAVAKWLVNTIGIVWSSADGTSTCPPDGSYAWSEDSFGGSTSSATANVS